eukprot:gb/GECH01008601.1/.p1 GENE.gb/GECH01008601.1/~~gb/GECH01008601.1/.p1  ORF type:complete len:275 (+),score=75.03 gb/GECH01008601.1/:1-825(+)
MESLRYKNKVVIVTASTRGIGYGIAKRIAQEGAKIVISSRSEENVKRAVENLQKELHYDHQGYVMGVVCHVANKEHRQRLINETLKRFGRIDVLISNAAANPYFGPMMKCPEEAWDKTFEVNVKSSFYLAVEVAKVMKKQIKNQKQAQSKPDYNILFISSVSGVIHYSKAMAGLEPYAVSKAALISLSKALAGELTPQGIRVNCVSPGLVKTDFSSALWQNEDAAKFFTKNFIFARRFGTPEDVAGVVAMVCSSDAQYVVGENIVVSGGIESAL